METSPVPRTMPATRRPSVNIHGMNEWIFKTSGGRQNYSAHFTDKKIATQRDEVICGRSCKSQLLAPGHTHFRASHWACSKDPSGASLVAQWLRICLPMQGIRVRALVWEDPTCCRATRPVSHNYCACVSGACAPQQERPR